MHFLNRFILVAVVLVGALSAPLAADLFVRQPHAWAIPVDLIKRDYFLQQSVYKGFPEFAAVIGRKYIASGGETGVWMDRVEGQYVVVGSRAIMNLLDDFDAAGMDLASIKTRAQHLVESELVVQFERPIPTRVAEAVIAEWREILMAVTVRNEHAAVGGEVYNFLSGGESGDVVDVDCKAPLAGGLGARLVSIYEALLRYAEYGDALSDGFSLKGM